MAVKFTFVLYKKARGLKTPAGPFVPHLQLLRTGYIPECLAKLPYGSESQFQRSDYSCLVSFCQSRLRKSCVRSSARLCAVGSCRQVLEFDDKL
jgi:hypothetical protein